VTDTELLDLYQEVTDRTGATLEVPAGANVRTEMLKTVLPILDAYEGMSPSTAILVLLKARPMTAGELGLALGKADSTVLSSLKLMRERGLAKIHHYVPKREGINTGGPAVYYGLADGEPDAKPPRPLTNTEKRARARAKARGLAPRPSPEPVHRMTERRAATRGGEVLEDTWMGRTSVQES